VRTYREKEGKIGMTITFKWIGFISVLGISSVLITGCKEKPPALTTEKQPPAVTVPSGQTATAPIETPAPPAGETQEAQPNPSDKVTLASTETPAAPPAIDTPPPVKPSPKVKVEIKEPYSQAKPSLLGLTLRTSAATIEARFGKPKEQFLMDEDADPITVYDYTDFLVGFNSNKQLQFIDVRSAELDPGLGGLRLGGTLNDVTQALGKPHASTGLVITYKASGAILKLDMDPKTKLVNSIKLFAE
jgi:type IV secretory pathway VirB10-like protein